MCNWIDIDCIELPRVDAVLLLNWHLHTLERQVFLFSFFKNEIESIQYFIYSSNDTLYQCPTCITLNFFIGFNRSVRSNTEHELVRLICTLRCLNWQDLKDRYFQLCLRIFIFAFLYVCIFVCLYFCIFVFLYFCIFIFLVFLFI